MVDYSSRASERPQNVRPIATVGSINSSSASGAIDNRQAAPPPITKNDLEAMRDRISKDGSAVPTGLDTLIAKFDDAAGSSGKMTFAQFKTFAADNGVTLPEPGKGGKPGGMPPMGGGGPMAASGGGGTKCGPKCEVEVIGYRRPPPASKIGCGGGI
jgi:hypothetical protein